ncbi:hypothetical protein Tco_0395014, partial [Tanacetum coccineum]
FNPFESLSPRGPSDNNVVLAAPSSKTVEGNPVSIGCMFPTESLGSDFLPSDKVCDLRVPSSSVEGNPVPSSCMFLTRSWGSGTVPEETEWDCSESFVGLDGVTLVSVGGFLDLGLLLFLVSAPRTSGPCDLGKVGVTV